MERRWWTLLASCIAIFMLLLDVTIVNVALPSIVWGIVVYGEDYDRYVDRGRAGPGV